MFTGKDVPEKAMLVNVGYRRISNRRVEDVFEFDIKISNYDYYNDILELCQFDSKELYPLYFGEEYGRIF